MKTQWEQDITELAAITDRLKHARDLDQEEAQELYYRKNFLESGLALDDADDFYEDDR